jgi:hypothetical protein
MRDLAPSERLKRLLSLNPRPNTSKHSTAWRWRWPMRDFALSLAVAFAGVFVIACLI